MKDIMKQPGIIANNVIVVQSDFKRERVFIPPLTYSCEFKYSINVLDNKEEGSGELQAQVIVKDKEDRDVFQISCTVVGSYREESESNMGIEEFLKNAAPAHLVAFVREHIANMSLKSGIPPLVLPPFNIKAMLAHNEITHD